VTVVAGGRALPPRHDPRSLCESAVSAAMITAVWHKLRGSWLAKFTPRRATLAGMVLEVALIDIQEGREDEFTEGYAKAVHLLTTTPGCRSVRMTRGVESPSRFVLLVEWDSVEAHLDNFRATERFAEWRGLIGPYFDGAPRVEHFVDVPATGQGTAAFSRPASSTP
jgi:heme-degrading monooxygenase HmoA